MICFYICLHKPRLYSLFYSKHFLCFSEFCTAKRPSFSDQNFCRLQFQMVGSQNKRHRILTLRHWCMSGPLCTWSECAWVGGFNKSSYQKQTICRDFWNQAHEFPAPKETLITFLFCSKYGSYWRPGIVLNSFFFFFWLFGFLPFPGSLLQHMEITSLGV